ncbi:Uncharacterised protein [Bordetella pertussis]|nr:Uncharacterised protein [Bordetella pertussis]
MPNSQGRAPSSPVALMKRSAKVWSHDSILAATLYWYQAATMLQMASSAASMAARRAAMAPASAPARATTPMHR